jgi:hypothetical protein
MTSAPIERLTVRELIERLQHYPDNLPVVVQSYEQGYDPVTQLEVIEVMPTPNREWYVGVYEKSQAQGEAMLLIASKYTRAEIDPK